MTGLPSLTVALAAVATLAATLAPVAPSSAGAVPPAAASAGPAAQAPRPAAVPGPALPAIPRLPDGALLVGADQRYAVYHANRLDPVTRRLELLLVSLTDGRVVREVAGPDVTCCDKLLVRYVDGSILVLEADGSVVRSDALTGEVTGTVAPVGDPTVLAVDDRWVLTPTAVLWFDGRVVPVLGDLPPDRFPRTLGDSSLAVLTGTRGSDPLVLTPSTGQVVPLARPGETVRVIAARGGRSPEVFGRVEPIESQDPQDPQGPPADEPDDGLARWTDPARAAGRAVVESDVTPTGGGFAGDRLIASVGEDYLGIDELVEVDPATGRQSPALIEDVLAESAIGDFPRERGESVVQAGDRVLVSRINGGRGALSLVTEQETRTLAALRPTLHSACRLYRDRDRIEVDLCSGHVGWSEVFTYRGTRVITVGQRAWTETYGPLGIPVRPLPLGLRPRATCPDGEPAPIRESRGRWQLERCPGGYRWYVTDRLDHLAPLLVRGVPRLGADHVLERVTSRTSGRDVLRVTGLDARHRTRLYGPLGADYAVDHTGGQSPVYVDATGRVRVADVSGLADTTSPSVRIVRRPARLVDSVDPIRLFFAARVRDAVDGARVTARLQVRRAVSGSPSLSRWRALATNASGSFSVTAAPGEHWCFRVLAFDRSGNERISAPSCAVVPVDDVQAERSETVRRVRSSDYLGGAATELAGTEGSLGVGGLAGSRVVVWLRTGPTGGQLVVRDGAEVVQRVETRTRRPGLRVVVLAPVGRRLQLEAARSGTVVVDAFGLQRRTYSGPQ